MIKKGYADLPLHYGRAPRWLFSRMHRLSGEIAEIIVNDYGKKEFLERISNPFWFQAFSCVLGFDWHSSGVTTTTCAALKMALRDRNLGIKVAGGKGSTSRKAPEELEKLANEFNLNTKKEEEILKATKLVAKVDNNALQDGFSLYHHSFFLTEDGDWSVVQQGMNNVSTKGMARRYHWLSSNLKNKDFVTEPHTGIACDSVVNTLNLTSKENKELQNESIDLLNDFREDNFKILKMQDHERILPCDLSKREIEYLRKVSDLKLDNYEELLLLKGMGPKKVRALALTSSLIYGKEISWRDPVKYSFAHGGKDGTPFPVNRKLYDKTISFLEDVVRQTNLKDFEKKQALRSLAENFG